MSATSLTREEIKELTGRTYIRLQIEALRKMGIPFFINDIGRPVVARSIVEGRASTAPEPPKKKWVSNALKQK